MLDLALVTANFGGIDNIRRFPADAGFDAFYYTEEATLATADPSHVASWPRIIVPAYPHRDFGPRLRAKYFKQQIHRLPETLPFRWLAWADSTVRFKNPAFLIDALATLRRRPARCRFMLIRHPTRATVREEYVSVVRDCREGNAYMRTRYDERDLEHQWKVYSGQGWNLDAPLWCGTIWLLERNEIMIKCLDEWWHHTIRFGVMDQISLPVVLEQFAIKPTELRVNLLQNRFFEWSPHAKLI